MTYTLFKFLHLLGVVFLIGNVTVTAVWKVFADRTHSPIIIAFAQRLVTYTDWAFTLTGVLLLSLGGYGMAMSAHMPLFTQRWLGWGQAMFALSGLIWIAILVPTQIRQARATRAFSAADVVIPESYRMLSRRWLLWGVIATIPLIVALFLMTSKF
ncbi:MAG: DUF2269 domain-containing protein [Gemmatimonadaceae bacterium]